MILTNMIQVNMAQVKKTFENDACERVLMKMLFFVREFQCSIKKINDIKLHETLIKSHIYAISNKI